MHVSHVQYGDRLHGCLSPSHCLFGDALNKNAANRSNKYKISNYTFHYNIRKYSICPRVVNFWNSLYDYVVDADNINTFKHVSISSGEIRICCMITDLTGMGSRSQVWLIISVLRYGHRGASTCVHAARWLAYDGYLPSFGTSPL